MLVGALAFAVPFGALAFGVAKQRAGFEALAVVGEHRDVGAIGTGADAARVDEQGLLLAEDLQAKVGDWGIGGGEDGGPEPSPQRVVSDRDLDVDRLAVGAVQVGDRVG